MLNYAFSTLQFQTLKAVKFVVIFVNLCNAKRRVLNNLPEYIYHLFSTLFVIYCIVYICTHVHVEMYLVQIVKILQLKKPQLWPVVPSCVLTRLFLWYELFWGYGWKVNPFFWANDPLFQTVDDNHSIECVDIKLTISSHHLILYKYFSLSFF